MFASTQTLKVSQYPEKHVVQSYITLSNRATHPDFASHWESDYFKKRFIDEFETLASSFHVDATRHGVDGRNLPSFGFIETYLPAKDAQTITTRALENIQSCYRETIDEQLLPRVFSQPLLHYVRWPKIQREAPELQLIEQSSFTRPWKGQDFIDHMNTKNCLGLVAETSDRIVGYAMYEQYDDRIHLVNLAVNPADRRQGIGKSLFKKLKSKLSLDIRTYLTAAVKEPTAQSEPFFRSQGCHRDFQSGDFVYQI